jgi:hypothetical protein
MTLTKEMNEEGDLATTMKKLEEKLRRTAEREIREFEQKTDPPSIITTSTYVHTGAC